MITMGTATYGMRSTVIATYPPGWYSGHESTWGQGDRDSEGAAYWHLAQLRREWPEDTFWLTRQQRPHGTEWRICREG